MSSGSPQIESPRPSADEASLTARDREILAAAIRQFAAQGFTATDVQDIAAAVGIGKGTIYRTFGNKEGLFLAAVRFARSQTIAAVDAAANEATDPLDHWRRGIRAFLQFFDDNPDVVELLIEERSLSRGQRVATFFNQEDACGERWRNIFRQLIEAGIIRDLPVEQVEQAISRSLFGTLFVNYFAGRPEPLAPQFETLFDILFRGLAKQG